MTLVDGRIGPELAHRRRPGRSRWRLLNRAVLLLLLGLAVLAPLLANDVPLMASVDGRWTFPAVASYFGPPPPGPDDRSWKSWWATLGEADPDWAVMPPWSFGPLETDPGRIKAGPSIEHPLGNDDTGRDLLARLLHGCTPAVFIGVGATVLGLLLGVLLGGLAGFRGGWVDVLVLRLIEVFLCFPGLLLVLAAAAVLGDSTLGIVLVLGLVFWTSFARIVRGELLSLRERDFVACARGLGVTRWGILRRHLLPQVRGPVAVTAAFCFAQAVVVESTLSFLGLGPGLKTASWGGILAQGKANAHLGVWHLWLFPALAIVATVICCHALADDIRERRPR